MRCLIVLFLALATLLSQPALAQVVSVETWVEEWDHAAQKWVRVEDGANRLARRPDSYRPNIYSPAVPKAGTAEKAALASYGPFRVIDHNHAELVGATNRASPADFLTMLTDYPAIGTLRLIEAPGTDDDRANMRVARMIRAAGIETHVPNGGSVRSGAVELFLAGATRRIDDGAEFAVHSWIDSHGRQPHDFAEDARPNRMYLDYYQEMGMSRDDARAFYSMTNSVGFADAKWLTAQEMRGWIGLDKIEMRKIEIEEIELNGTAPVPLAPNWLTTESDPKKQAAPRIAYLDLKALLP